MFEYSVTTVTTYVAFNPLRGNYWQVYLWHFGLLVVEGSADGVVGAPGAGALEEVRSGCAAGWSAARPRGRRAVPLGSTLVVVRPARVVEMVSRRPC